MRLAVDLGLHQEAPREHAPSPVAEDDTLDHLRNTKRRLWWSTYSLDRLVSVSVGRPFSISDQDISTPMPTETPQSPDAVPMRCDQVAQHFIRLRILQSQVLARKKGSQNRLHSHTKDGAHIAPWVQELEQRLNNWRLAAPAKDTTGVAFPKAMVEFYYWQSIIVLYQRCVSTNDLLGEVRGVKAEGGTTELPDHEDTRYLKVAEAGQKLLRMYRQRHLAGCIKYTYSSAYYLLRVCILYLHAVAVSQAVRSRFVSHPVHCE